jgi:hypothetical protein
MESNNTNHRPENLSKLQNKDNNFKAQEKRYIEYLKIHIATNSMVTKATGIPQKNLTRYKREFEKKGILKEVHRKFYMLTGFRASSLTTNPDLMRKSINPKKS